MPLEYTNHNGKITLRKSLGLVRDGFSKKHIDRLKGPIGIGHVRYPTAGHADILLLKLNHSMSILRMVSLLRTMETLSTQIN